MKDIMKSILAVGLLLGSCAISAMAQNSAPAPGAGEQIMPGGIPQGPGPVISAPGSPSGLGGPNVNIPPNPDGGAAGPGPAPAPGSGVYNPGPATPPPPANWGCPMGCTPMIVNTPLSSPNWQNSGTETVMACGYDAQGVWRVIPIRVQYNYNGAQYNVTVLSAWNPWTDMWNTGIDVPAFNTTYFLNGNTYDFYTNLSTGTFYFNL